MESRREVMLLALVLGLCLPALLHAQLQVGFYRETCPLAEAIVKDVVGLSVEKDPGLAANFVRMHFHDCFVRGCDGSILIDSTKNNMAEKDSPFNKPSLRGFDVVDAAKAKLEKACRGVVSCADVVAFAARDSVKLSGGLGYEVPAGRRDGRISRSTETFTDLPRPAFNLAQLTQNFAAKGLTQAELVTLSGAHTIGVSHCTSITSRLYNFSTTAATDPILDPAYAKSLKAKCPPASAGSNLTVPMDPPTPAAFDSGYYVNVLANRGLFGSDQALTSSAQTALQVRRSAADQRRFQQEFAEAMVTMGRIGVLTGRAGEIRLNCRVAN